MNSTFMNRITAIIWCCFLVLAATAGAATPEEVADKYLTALRKEGLRSTVKFFHPEEQQKVADLIIELASSVGEGSERPPFLENGETVESLKKQTALQLTEKFFGWMEKAVPQIASVMKTAQVKVIGHLADGDTVYLVSKLTFELEGEKVETTDVLPMKKLGDDYRVLMKGDFAQILKAVKKKFGK